MRRRSGIAKLAALMLAGAAMGLAQLSSGVSLSNGVEVRVIARLGQPTGEEKLSVEMAPASGNSFYRIFRDQNNLAVFAYELAVGRSDDGGEFHFTAKPAGTEFAARFPNADAGKPVPTLPAEREFQPLHSGDSDELGLFEIPGMGLSVADSIRVTVSQEGAAAESGGPLRFAGLKVSLNGSDPEGPARGSVSGRYAMFYVPGHGGYFFSTEAPAGRAFVKAGSIDGARLVFTVDNESYDCTADSPILANAASGEVWVYHDPAYKPAGNWTQDLRNGEPARPAPEEFFAAAADSLSWWLP